LFLPIVIIFQNTTSHKFEWERPVAQRKTTGGVRLGYFARSRVPVYIRRGSPGALEEERKFLQPPYKQQRLSSLFDATSYL
jgi:hypothetical protein